MPLPISAGEGGGWELTWYMIGTETPVRSLYRAKRKQSVRACVHASISICAVHEVNIHAYQLSASAI